MVIRTMLGAAAILAGMSAVVAQSDPVSERKALMKGNVQGAIALSKMVRGQEPFDAAKVDAAIAQFIDTARKLPGLFPEDSKPKPPLGRYSASLKVWETKADFDAKSAAFGKVAADTRDKAKTLDGLKASFEALDQSCNACHEVYRVRN